MSFNKIALDETVVQAKAQLASCAPEETWLKELPRTAGADCPGTSAGAALCSDILPALQEIAQEMVANPLMDDSMVLNVALLLDEKRCPELDRTLDRLDASFESRGYQGSSALVFRCIGPLPLTVSLP